jgi:hypothetical protein
MRREDAMHALTRFLVAGSALICVCTVYTAAAAAAPAAGLTTAQFLARCMKEPDFCRTRIGVETTRLNALRETCPPPALTPDAAGDMVRELLEEASEETPDVFAQGAYQGFVDQIVTFLWPCPDIS